MFYYLYKITNWYNGKIYIGVHKTKNLDDGYMGSGHALYYAKKKYGPEYFTKDILQFFDSEQEMYDAEEAIVDEEFLKSKWTYNRALGGSGGWRISSQDAKSRAVKLNEFMSMKMKDPEYRIQYCNKISSTIKRLIEEGKFIVPKSKEHHSKESKDKISKSLLGIKHSEETRCNMSKSKMGDKNYNYETYCIHNDALRRNKNIPKGELAIWLDAGWLKGRVYYKVTPENLRKQRSESVKGKRWIHHKNESKDKMVPAEDLQFWFEQGWEDGRTKEK